MGEKSSACSSFLAKSTTDLASLATICSVADCTFNANAARQYAGALECASCSTANITG